MLFSIDTSVLLCVCIFATIVLFATGPLGRFMRLIRVLMLLCMCVCQSVDVVVYEACQSVDVVVYVCLLECYCSCL